jgi:hypothetical protein
VTNHPITPPYELVEQWRKEPEYTDGNKLVTMVTMTTDRLMQLCEKSAQHGADQELEACCEEMKSIPSPLGIPFGNMASNALCTARRPKPPSLKEQALADFDWMVGRTLGRPKFDERSERIRRALEQLND